MRVSEKKNSDLGSSLGVEPDGWSELLQEESGIEERKNEFIQSSLGNRDYVKSAFERDLNDVRTRLSSDSLKKAEEMMPERISQYSFLAFRCFASGQATISELVKDPFLRRKHFDALLDIRMGGEYDDAIRRLWSSDANFVVSTTYFDGIGRVIEDNPDIYSSVDKEGVEKRINEVIKDFSTKIDFVMDRYNKDVWTGNEALVTCLKEMLLGSSGEKVTLRNSRTSLDGACGEWKFDKREVFLYEEQTMKKVMEKTKQTNGALSHNGELVLHYINTIAHEMWHAYQDLGKNFDKRTIEMYRKNSAYYVPFEYSYSKYRKQLIEMEAFMFGDKLESFIRKMARFYNLD